MANTFKNAYQDVTSTPTDFVTAPATAGDIAIVLTLRVTNVDGSASDTITAEVIDSDGTTKSYLAYQMIVPAGTSVELAGVSKIVLETSDKIQLTSGAASGDLEAFASILEIT